PSRLPMIHRWRRKGTPTTSSPPAKLPAEGSFPFAVRMTWNTGRCAAAYSPFGRNTSGIALATNKTLDPKSPQYKWVDEGLVLESKATDDFNAIDPNYVEDAQHHAWLDFGSFWSGIKMRALDAATGKLSTKDTKLYSLASRVKPTDAAPAKPGLPPDWEAIEAPFIVHHGEYYYLFASFDLCCRGTESTYRTMVGRSRSITGPYMDKQGTPM